MQTYTFSMNNLWYVVDPVNKTLYSTATKPAGITEKAFNPQDGIGLVQIPDPNSTNPQPILVSTQGFRGPMNVTINGRKAILNDTTGLDANGTETKTTNGTVIYEDGTIDRVPLSQIYITSTGYAPATFNQTQQAMRDVYTANTNPFTPLSTYQLPTQTPPPAPVEPPTPPVTETPPTPPVTETVVTPTTQEPITQSVVTPPVQEPVLTPQTPPPAPPVAEPEQQVQPTPATPEPVQTPLTPQTPPVETPPAPPTPPTIDYSTLPHILISPRWAQDGWASSNGVQAGDKIYADGTIISPDGTIKKEVNGLVSATFRSNTQSYIYPTTQNTTTQEEPTTPPPSPTPPAPQTETPPVTTTPPVSTVQTPPPQTPTTPTPTTYTPPAGTQYFFTPTGTIPWSNKIVYADGTMTDLQGNVFNDATYTKEWAKTLFDGASPYKGNNTNPDTWVFGTTTGSAVPTKSLNTPPPPTTSNPLIPANQTPSQISANPLNMESILSASQGNLNWNLSNWNSQGSAFTQQPVLTVNGQSYTFSTPGEYINALSQIKNTGATGNLDQFISQFQAVTQYFPPTTTVGTVNTYNPQSYAPAPVNNSTNTGTNYNTNVDPNGTIAYNNTSTNTMNSIQPPSVQLQIGDTGDAVKQLQDFLVSKGFMTQAQVNTGYGNFGSQTQQAVSAFQQAYGVDTSAGGVGRYGPLTMSKAQSLVTQQPTQNTNPPTNTNTNTNTNTQTGGVNLSTGNMGQVNPPAGTTQVGTAPINTTPTTQNPANTYNQPATTYNFPTVSLSPGQSGADVQKLQNYLVQTGYMTQEQVNTGYGYYGTQTTEAVRQLQQDLGVDNSTGVGYWGPRTLTAVQTATANIQNNNTGTTPTNTGTTPTNTNTGTTPTTPIGSTTGNNTSTGITLQQFNSAMQDPVFTSWYANPENKAQFDALSFDQKSFLLLHTSSLSNTIQNGQVVNPNIQVTPAQLAMFYDQAKSELEPYYTDTYRTLANDVSQSLTRLKEDFDKTLARAVDPFKSALEKQAEDEAQSGTAFSSGRNKRESTMVTEQNNAISDVFQTAERSAQDLLRGYESKVGTNKASSLATPNLSLYNASNRGMTQSGSRTINPALIGGVTYGSIGAEQTVSTKKRASEIEQVFRTDRALNNLTI